MGKFVHGFARRSQKTVAYRRWESMHRRCRLPSQRSYPLYGGRGITVCERWSDYRNFVADMGECEPGDSLDRIDPDGNYEPGNCRWLPSALQARNTRRNLMLTFGGRTQCVAAWAEELGMRQSTLRMRITAYGWPVEKALSTPTHQRFSHLRPDDTRAWANAIGVGTPQIEGKK